MNHTRDTFESKRTIGKRSMLDRKLAGYVAAVVSGSLVAKEVGAVVISNSSVQSFGINGAVPIDFNGDGQVDFEIDHDRVDLGGGLLVDYLQLDKNDTNGSPMTGENPCPIDVFDTFDTNSTPANDTFDAAYVIPAAQGDYPAALLAGQEIGPLSMFDFQEGDNFQGTGITIRANRLIDEDAGQCDEAICGLTDAQTYDPTSPANFIGLGGQTRYLGVKMDFQSAGGSNTSQVNYGWIGIRITNEADATGQVVGWGYETEIGTSILAGETGVEPSQPGDFNGDGKVDAADYVKWRKTDAANEALYNEWRSNFGEPPPGAGFAALGSGVHGVPEPSSLLLTLGTGLAMLATFFWRRIRR
jgi:hypothetical protein